MRGIALQARPARVLLAAGLAALACSPAPEPPAEGGPSARGPLSVYVVNYPLRYFAERIGGEHVEVQLPAPPDVDPAFWQPDPETVAAYQGADLVLLNGAGYARWTELASLPRARTVDTSAAFGDRLIPLDEAVSHRHGPSGEHSHASWAITTWLDPELAVLQAGAVAAALARARPGKEATFRAHLEELEAELRTLDARLAEVADRIGGAPVLFSHPVYQYLQRRYGLNGRSLDWEPQEEPPVEEWQALESLRVEHPARVVLWEAEPLAGTRARLSAMGLRTVVFDPCANASRDGDYLAVMARNADSVARAFDQGR